MTAVRGDCDTCAFCAECDTYCRGYEANAAESAARAEYEERRADEKRDEK